MREKGRGIPREDVKVAREDREEREGIYQMQSSTYGKEKGGGEEVEARGGRGEEGNKEEGSEEVE